jgi:hypothetical protein
MYPDLDKKMADITPIAQHALVDERYRNHLLENLLVKKENIRYNSFRALKRISEDQPELLYPQWDFFENHMHSQNSYHKMSAVLILADLCRIDMTGKFEKIFDEFYDLLDDKSMVVSAYVSNVSRKIVGYKPELEQKITRRLLAIDRTRHRDDRKELIKAWIIESFELYFARSFLQKEILSFVKKQTGSGSNKTRKAAKKFLDRYNH